VDRHCTFAEFFLLCGERPLILETDFVRAVEDWSGAGMIANGAAILVDDSPYKAGKWRGKGAKAIPRLLAHGWWVAARGIRSWLAVQRYAGRDVLEGQGVTAILPKWRLVVNALSVNTLRQA
jgi:hypothetical protein